MNHLRKQAAQLDDDSRFDRLVDGELSAGEYRELLAALEDQPGGWRRCALAFLESQALARDLGGVRQTMNLSDGRPGAATIDPGSSSPSPAPRRLGPFEWRTLLLVAASFLVAFGLGVYGPKLIAMRRAATPLAGTQQPTVDLAAEVSPRLAPRPGGRQRSSQPIGNVRFVVNDGSGGTPSTRDLPVYEAPEDVAGWMNQDRQSLAPELIDQLKRRGHQVERQKQYIPVQLEDGRQIIVPVEGYQITPGSGPMY